ncbi:MAG: phosphoglycerate mutase [Rhodobacterales bacterium]|nr:MAG: phosphoglycerate mutase [Rhodobacterales bacterium]
MSLRLILMRHAKSSWGDPMANDHDRPLNARGRRSAKALGKWLTEKGYVPDHVLCSTAQRTRETFEGLGLTVPVSFHDALYHASTFVLLDTLQSEACGDTVLLITHNPGCADFADRIVAAPPEHPRFHDYPTGATLVAEFDVPTWHDIDFKGAHTLDFIVPRSLTD